MVLKCLFKKVSKTIKFGRTPARNCANIAAPTTPSTEAWEEQKLCGEQHKTFYVQIGPPAGDKGYKAITGIYISKL